MQVTLQDCGCIALPDQVAASLGLAAGSILELGLDEASRSLTLTAVSRPEVGSEGLALGSACAVGKQVR